MRSLVLASETPVPARSGFPLRVLHLARALARAADVEVAALGCGEQEPPPHEPFRLTLVPEVRRGGHALPQALWLPRPVARIDSPDMAALAARHRWDTVQAHGVCMLRFALCAGVPVVYDSPDVTSRQALMLARLDPHAGGAARWVFEHVKARAYERHAAHVATAVTVPCDDDAELFERLGATRVAVVPNGVDTGAVEHRPPAPGARLVFVGFYSYLPNRAAALELTDEILPRVRAVHPTASVTLVGMAPPAELRARAGAHVEVTGTVDDVLPYLRSARVAVLPIRGGGGTRLKALEAFAAGVPVVCTPFAAAGLGARDGDHVLFGRTPAELAAQAARVIADDALAERLSNAARKLAEERFSWERVAQPLVELHEDLARRGSKRRSQAARYRGSSNQTQTSLLRSTPQRAASLSTRKRPNPPPSS